MIRPTQRRDALRMLEGDSPILETARAVTRQLAAAGVDGVIIGGLAVVLHGHVRTTVDVDVFAPDLDAVATALKAGGFSWDRANRQFLCGSVPVHLVGTAQLREPPVARVEIEGIRTIPLAELLTMKLRSGTRDVLRAQDLADVIGLIRVHELSTAYARRLARDVRGEFRKLAEAVARGAQP
jgi:hypothetical protein